MNKKLSLIGLISLFASIITQAESIRESLRKKSDAISSSIKKEAEEIDKAIAAAQWNSFRGYRVKEVDDFITSKTKAIFPLLARRSILDGIADCIEWDHQRDT